MKTTRRAQLWLLAFAALLFMPLCLVIAGVVPADKYEDVRTLVTLTAMGAIAWFQYLLLVLFEVRQERKTAPPVPLATRAQKLRAIGRWGRFWLWLTGSYDWAALEARNRPAPEEDAAGYIRFSVANENWYWRMEMPGLTLEVPAAPNCFHRYMQRLILGMKWRLLD